MIFTSTSFERDNAMNVSRTKMFATVMVSALLASMKGITVVKVDLEAKTATIKMAKAMSKKEAMHISKALNKGGFAVRRISPFKKKAKGKKG